MVSSIIRTKPRSNWRKRELAEYGKTAYWVDYTAISCAPAIILWYFDGRECP
jgi:hypothetical protein